MLLDKISKMAIPVWAYVLFYAVLLGGVSYFTFSATSKFKDAIWEKQISSLELAAAQKNLDHEKEVRVLEVQLAKIDTESEVTNRERKSEIENLRLANRDLIAKHGLYDPGSKPKSCPTATVSNERNTSVDSGETSGARLSKEAEEFLWQFAYEADAAAVYATGCWERENKSKEVGKDIFTKTSFVVREYENSTF